MTFCEQNFLDPRFMFCANVPHMNHVSVSPTNGNGPTQGQRKTLTRVGIEPMTFGLDLRCSNLLIQVISFMKVDYFVE